MEKLHTALLDSLRKSLRKLDPSPQTPLPFFDFLKLRILGNLEYETWGLEERLWRLVLLWYLNYLVLEYVVFFDSLVQHLGVPELQSSSCATTSTQGCPFPKQVPKKPATQKKKQLFAIYRRKPARIFVLRCQLNGFHLPGSKYARIFAFRAV